MENSNARFVRLKWDKHDDVCYDRNLWLQTPLLSFIKCTVMLECLIGGTCPTGVLNPV